MDNAFLDARIVATQAIIVAYEEAITAVSGGKVTSYTLDTGQSRQVVTKLDINGMRIALNSAYNLLETLNARRHGSGGIGVPGW